MEGKVKWRGGARRRILRERRKNPSAILIVVGSTHRHMYIDGS